MYNTIKCHKQYQKIKNTIIILTSNVGSENFSHSSNVEEKVIDELKNTFKSEFINRIDEIVVFNLLEEEDLKKVIKIQMDTLKNRLIEKNIIIDSKSGYSGAGKNIKKKLIETIKFDDNFYSKYEVN